MTVGEFLDALGRMPLIPPAAFLPAGPVVVLSPHPDDESLGLGGTIAAATAAGTAVHIAFLTDGAASHPSSPSYPPARLAALRRDEAGAAAAILGVPASQVSHFDLPDAGTTLAGPMFDATVGRLRHLLKEAGASALLVTWGRDPHCDHEAAEAIARAVRDGIPGLALWAYPIWGRHLPRDTPLDETLPDGLRLDIAPWLDVKHRAIAAHASQMTDLIDDDPTGFRFTPDTLAPFLEPVEYVFRVP